ncbi:MAG: hypothetical protein mread185_000320 [Mycoplasmataceae bacterium]|nr:MAG: hypothetical protein mread185_000320 [Mycoplasmataceae bacterium]
MVQNYTANAQYWLNYHYYYDGRRWLDGMRSDEEVEKAKSKEKILDIGKEILKASMQWREGLNWIEKILVHDSYNKPFWMKLIGSLDLNELADLEELFFNTNEPQDDYGYQNEIDLLKIDNCKKVRKIDFKDSNINSLEINNYPFLEEIHLNSSRELKKLVLTNNLELVDIDLTGCVKLTELVLINNPKLKGLSIIEVHPNINIKLENLPKSLEKFYFSNISGLAEEMKGCEIREFAYDYQRWRRIKELKECGRWAILGKEKVLIDDIKILMESAKHIRALDEAQDRGDQEEIAKNKKTFQIGDTVVGTHKSFEWGENFVINKEAEFFIEVPMLDENRQSNSPKLVKFFNGLKNSDSDTKILPRRIVSIEDKTDYHANHNHLVTATAQKKVIIADCIAKVMKVEKEKIENEEVKGFYTGVDVYQLDCRIVESYRK